MDIDVSFVIQYNYFVVVLLKVNCISLTFFLFFSLKKKKRLQKNFHLRSNWFVGRQSVSSLSPFDWFSEKGFFKKEVKEHWKNMEKTASLPCINKIECSGYSGRHNFGQGQRQIPLFL